MTTSRRLKVAFIGTHGVGKTTLCYGLAARLKARDVVLEVVHEVARRCPLAINQETGVAAQSWILHTQIAEELVAAERYPVVVCDRSALDNYAYLLLAQGSQPGLEEMVGAWMHTYQLLILVPTTEAPTADGVRATDPEFQRAVDARLRMELESRELPTLQLSADTRDNWLDESEAAVLTRLASPQLRFF